MALQECGSNLNKASKELQPHGSPQFPCAGYASCHTDRQEDVILWDWHEEMEIAYIDNGQMNIRIPSKTFLLEKGDCIVIGSNVLHYAKAVTDCKLRSLVFSQTLITGNADSVFAKKYMQPLSACDRFTHYLIKAGKNENVVDWSNHAFEALAQDRYGYEFTVREDLSLSEISGAADISERESLRCFKKTIQLSPIQYLLKYRIMQGAEMLLNDPTGSISEIATLCGFDSPSNFSKLFKRYYNCTPSL